MRSARAPWFVAGGLLAGFASGLAHGAPVGGSLVGVLAGWLAWLSSEDDDDEGDGVPVEHEEAVEAPRLLLAPQEG